MIKSHLSVYVLFYILSATMEVSYLEGIAVKVIERSVRDNVANAI